MTWSGTLDSTTLSQLPNTKTKQHVEEREIGSSSDSSYYATLPTHYLPNISQRSLQLRMIEIST